MRFPLASRSRSSWPSLPFRAWIPHGLRRIGVTNIAHLKWLLDFAYEDLANLSQGQLSDRGWEAVALLLIPNFQGGIGDWIIPLTIFTESTPDDRKRKVSEQSIRKFHDLLRPGLDRLFKGPGWTITVPERKMTIGLTGSPLYGMFMLDDGLPLEDRLKIVAFNLINTEIRRLGNCRNPNCKRPFVAARKGRAFFCSPRCSAYVRVNRARGKTEKLKGI